MSIIGRVAPFFALAPATPPVYAAWNPSDKGANITLSNGNLTLSVNGSFNQCVRGDTFKSAGKWYFEYVVSTGGSFAEIGVDNGSAALTSAARSGSQAIVYQSGGGVFKAGSTIATYTSYGNGDVIGIAMDAATGNVTFYLNGTLQGNPGSITGSMYPIAGNQLATPVIGTANFGATTLTYTPPSGYNAGLYT